MQNPFMGGGQIPPQMMGQRGINPRMGTPNNFQGPNQVGPGNMMPNMMMSGANQMGMRGMNPMAAMAMRQNFMMGNSNQNQNLFQQQMSMMPPQMQMMMRNRMQFQNMNMMQGQQMQVPGISPQSTASNSGGFPKQFDHTNNSPNFQNKPFENRDQTSSASSKDRGTSSGRSRSNGSRNDQNNRYSSSRHRDYDSHSYSRSDDYKSRDRFDSRDQSSCNDRSSRNDDRRYTRKRRFDETDSNCTSDTETESRERTVSGSERGSRPRSRSRSPRRYKRPSNRDRREDRNRSESSRYHSRDRDSRDRGDSRVRNSRDRVDCRDNRDRDHNSRDRSSYSRDSGRDDGHSQRHRDDSVSRRDRRDDRSESRDRASLRGEEPGSDIPDDAVEDEDAKLEEEDMTPKWVRCSPADLYFTPNHTTGCMEGTKKMKDLEDTFEYELVQWSSRVKAEQTESVPPHVPRPPTHHHHHHHHGEEDHCESSSDSDSSSSSDSDEEVNARMEELERKKKHPHLLHSEMWYNEPGQVNDGPLCRCSIKSQKTGIRHNVYPGEKEILSCDKNSNNKDKLFHYRVAMSPPTNFLTKCPTIIVFDNHEFIFEGFSILSHYKLEKIPICRVIRFNIEYTIHFIEEPMPENFTVRSVDLFTQYLFNEILELIDIDWYGPVEKPTTACHIMHMMPRFSRSLPENGKEVLSMNEVLSFLLKSAKTLIEPSKLPGLLELDASQWQEFIDIHRGMIVIYPGKRPCAIRIDQLDRNQLDPDVQTFPLIIHFGSRPAQLSYVGDPAYQRLWKQYIKFRHLLSSKPKVSAADKLKLHAKEQALQELRTKSTMKREVTVEISSEGFICTGFKSDISQHAMLIPVLLGHLRFHKCLSELEKIIDYQFKDRYLLQLALTHTSYRVNYGTNPDHARNTLANAGRRQVEYGSRKVLMQNTRKRGLNILIDIMSRMGKSEESLSDIPHNERLEFLGDAVVEFLSSVHLFYMFPWLEEGGLSTYRTAIVQNQHLAILAKKLRLQEFMLYAHGPDLCHEYDLRHAMANCFEALMGALFIDGGIELADRIFGTTLFGESEELLATWRDVPHHPLQEDQPNGDRQWIESSHILQKILKFEGSIGVVFDHIRILARAFTPRNVGYTNLTLGHNQRLEFLGDTVLQLIASEYLFKHFPEHHEGHLTLLRSSLVNNRTQSIVCDDLGMTEYVIYDRHIRDRGQLKTKEKADLLEAFIGALYVDKDLDYGRVFCEVCFFPRLQDFILNQDWNDPKSQLQQCCLTLRELDGGEPDIPIYKVIESKGPTNTRMYVVAVYFRGERLATGEGHSIQQAEMSAATNAMNIRQELFPIINHQKRFLENRYRHLLKSQEGKGGDSSSESSSHSKYSRHSRGRHSSRGGHRHQSKTY